MVANTPDTTTSLANLLPNWFDKLLLETFDKSVKFYQFAESRPIPQGEGKTITWNRWDRLALGYQLTEGVTPSDFALTTTKISTIAAQYGGVAFYSDFVDLTAITDINKGAVERLAAQAAETVDTVIQQAIIAHANTTNSSVVHYTKHSAGAYTTITTSAPGVVLAAATLAVSDIRDMAFYLRGLDIPGYDRQNSYVAITSPAVANTIQADTTWVGYHQYVEKGINDIYNGELGQVHGVRFVTTTLNRVSAGSADRAANIQVDAASAGAATPLAHATVLFGRQFFGVSELGGSIQMYTTTGADKSDPLNQISTVGWKAFVGAQVLNASAGVVLWSGINQTFSGCLVSARAAAGLRIYDPTLSS